MAALRAVDALVQQLGEHGGRVRWRGASVDGLLRTPFRCERGAMAALGSLGLSAAALCGDEAEVEVEVEARAAAAAVRQDRYLLRDGAPITVWDALSGLYRVGDGRWVQLHCNFPHHRERAVVELGLAPGASREEVAAAVARQRDAWQLEDRLTAAGAAAAVVRTRAEWTAHPQCGAVRALPLVQVERVAASGPAACRVAPGGSGGDGGLLEGVRCLDLSRVIAGPVAGRTLADLGAQVLRVGAAHLPTVEGAVLATGHGKRAANVDLRCARGQAEMQALLKEADVVINAFRPGSMQAHGIGPDLLRSKPGLVLVELSAYGGAGVGPWGGKRGYDSLVQAATGMVHTQTRALGTAQDAPPVHLPVQFLDYVAGFLAARAVLQCFKARRMDPQAAFHVRLSLCRVAEWLWDLGLKADEEWAAAADVPASAIDDLLVETPLPRFGDSTLRSLGIPWKLTKHAPRLGGPPVPVGTDEARWVP